MRKIYGDMSFQRFPITEKQKIVNMTIKEQKAFFDIFIVKMIIKVCRHIFK